jgi:hypothetical protein
MNVQVPNIPFGNNSPNFYEDFKEYCKTPEWRIFIQKQVNYLKLKNFLILVNYLLLNLIKLDTTIKGAIFSYDNKSVSNEHEDLVE